MKKYAWVIILFVGFAPTESVNAQSAELTQLILNIEKLAQLKEILQTMKQYYDILTTGYNAVRDISQGNFSIHSVFLNGLLEVSPSVKKYHRVVDIVEIQLQLVKEYKAALKRTRNSHLLHSGELAYLEQVYQHLLDESLKNLSDLTVVLTANQLRMSDEERLSAIDAIYEEMSNKLTFLRHFNNSTAVLLIQRDKEQKEAKAVQKLIDTHP